MSTNQAEKIEFYTSEQQTVFDKLFQPIQVFVEEQNNAISPHHNQTYFYYDFVRTLVFYFMSGRESLKLFINTVLNNGLLPDHLNLRPVPYSTFSDAFERFPSDLFREIFVFLLSSLPLKKIPELVSLGTLCCVDGSLFPVISSMLWAEYTSKSQALRFHLCFELNRMIAVDFIIGSGKSSERGALRKMLKSGITYIADRGYMCFTLFHDIINCSSYFVFRVKSNLVYLPIESMDVILPATVRTLFENVTDSLIRCTNDQHNHIYRLVIIAIRGETFYLLTNRFNLSTFQIIMLYAYRWQIELFFRFLKRTIGGIHLVKNTQQGVTIQFYVLLICALLELNLKQDTYQYKETGTIQNSTTDLESNADNAQKIHDSAISNSDQFLEFIGSGLKKYWKISVHWLSALRILMCEVFDARVIEILGAL